MKYLTINDLETVIKKNIIDDLSENNYDLLNRLEDISIGMVDGYIGFKFDTHAAMRARNPFLIMLVIDLFAYHFATRMSHTEMQRIREDRYIEAKNTLMDISKGKIVPNLPMNEEIVGEFVSKNEYITDNRIGGMY